MDIFYYGVRTRNVCKLDSTLNYISILQPVYSNVYLQCSYFSIF